MKTTHARRRRVLAANTVPNPLRYDPSRTGMIRRAAAANVTRAFAELARRVYQLVEGADAFGLAPPPDPLANRRHAFGSTQFDVTDPEVLAAVRLLQLELPAADVVELETTPHVTVRYGLHDEPDLVWKVNVLMTAYGPATARLGRLSLFTNPGKPDVLKFDVDGEQLWRMYQRLGLVPNTATHAEYRPHLTVAYLKEGAGARVLADLPPQFHVTGQVLTFTKLVVSDRDRNRETVLVNAAWAPGAPREQVKAFRDWLRQQTREVVTSTSQEVLWDRFTTQAYTRGAARSVKDAERLKPDPLTAGQPKAVKDFAAQAKTRTVVRPEKLRRVTGRTFDEVKGMSEDMLTKMSRVLHNGLEKRHAPRTVARDLVKQLGISRTRALAIARTEIIRAQADGQLDALEQLGQTTVMANVEFTGTSGSMCPACARLAGKVFTVKSARGIVPVHPNCRCAWTPAVGKYATGRRSRVPHVTTNAFCPTGKGGGVDATCPPAGSRGRGWSYAGHVAARTVVLPDGRSVKFKRARTHPRYLLRMVDANRLDELWANDKGFHIPRGGGGAEIAGRREKFRRFLDTGKEVEASEVYLSADGKTVSFGDGRHRFSVLRDLGASKVGVTITRDQAARFDELFGPAAPTARTE